MCSHSITFADLQRELLSLQREEQKLINDIKKTAKQGNTQATKTLAKSLVRIRGQMNQLRASEAHLRGVKYAVTVRPSLALLTHATLMLDLTVTDLRYFLNPNFFNHLNTDWIRFQGSYKTECKSFSLSCLSIGQTILMLWKTCSCLCSCSL